MTKLLLISVFIVLVLSSCETEHILLDNHEGIVLDEATKKVISGVEVYTDSAAYDYFEPVITNEEGYFFTPGLILPHYDKGYSWRKHMSYTLIFRCPGYLSDTVYLNGDSNQIIDTVDLGEIYLTRIKSQQN